MKMSTSDPLCRMYAALLLSCCFATIATAADRAPVTSIKPLMLAAIERGEAHGELIGDAASFMRGHFGSTAPIEIDVRAISQLRQAGCKRLEITTRQEDVREKRDQPSTRKALIFLVSYCRDGRFPEIK
jgi:hypothetical protein